MNNLLAMILLLFSGIWLGATSVTPNGSGTQIDPYQIATLDNLQWVSETDSSWGSWFVQTADIDASDTHNWNGGEGWNTIGFFNTASDYQFFYGHYNGQNHTISNLYINRPNNGHQALFAYVQSAFLTNIGVLNAEVHGDYFSGVLVGEVGYSSEISNCYTSGEVNGNDNDTGGLAGTNEGILYNCYANSNVTGNVESTGGLVGSNRYEGSINNCYATGNVAGGSYNTGGLAGLNGGNISNCYATGSIIGHHVAGGLIGHNNGILSKCYSTGRVTADGYDYGGFIGINSGTITGCFWNVETSGQSNSDGGVRCTTAQMQSITTYLSAGWDFIDETANGTRDIWAIDPANNGGYPFLAHNNTPVGDDETSLNHIPQNEITLSNYPNPFNPKTTISYSLAEAHKLSLSIYNSRGQLVRTFALGNQARGLHTLEWNGTDSSGEQLPSGVYLIRLQADRYTQTHKAIMLK